MADQLAKTAARDKDKTTYYSRIPLSTLFRELEEESKPKWQQKWEESPKAALTKQFYPRIKDRLKSKIDITSQLWFQDTVKLEPTYTDSNYWKGQHVLATKEIRLRTTCYTIATYFINRGKNS